MRAVAAAGAVAVALALCAGCGGHARSPEAVVRAWIRALDANDNRAAAALFAPGAQVVEGTTVLRLRSPRAALVWNRGLPCSAKLVSLAAHGDTVTATFLLGDRAGPCDADGEHATTIFRVRGGKIVLWHLLPAGGTPTTTAPTL